MNFHAATAHGFVRVAACTTPTAIADPAANAAVIIDQAEQAAAAGAALVIFPELSVTGYAIEDLLLQDPLIEAASQALGEIARRTQSLDAVVVVGAPLRSVNRMYNCAVVIHRGGVLGVVPKSYIPNYREFYEKRHHASGDDQRGGTIMVNGTRVPFGVDLLFAATDVEGLVLSVEICEDMWVPVPPSSLAALAGATVLANLSGSPTTVGRARDRHLLCRAQSARSLAAYVYAATGQGESTTDLSWDGMTMIYECGDLLGESERFPEGPRQTIVDVDLDRIRQDRIRDGSIADNARTLQIDHGTFRTVEFILDQPQNDQGLLRPLQRFPFVPDEPELLAQDCYEAFNIQVSALVQRLTAIGNPKIVIGVSGGLDSTQALLVAAQAMDRLQRPRTDIIAYTLPGFATSAQTKSNAEALSTSLGVDFHELDIRPAAERMLADIGHPYASGEQVFDTTFENVQAGLRTDYLFRIANQRGGIVLGTGDLSELALGWATYGVGDQMSHYAVNTGLPKTLIQHLIRWVADTDLFGAATSTTLTSILGTEISPELVPGEQLQSTESIIGPYALQDFTLHHILRYGFRPSKIAYLALQAWGDADRGSWPPNFPEDRKVAYDLPTIRHWLEVFLNRYFAFSQFKRSALPNGPKVVAGGSLSPRGDWRAPSDGNAEVWLADLAKVPSGDID